MGRRRSAPVCHPDNCGTAAEEWTTAEHVDRYPGRADEFARRAEGESVLLDHVPREVRRVLDRGTGDGRLLALLERDRPHLRGVGLDYSGPRIGRPWAPRSPGRSPPVAIGRRSGTGPAGRTGGNAARVERRGGHRREPRRGGVRARPARRPRDPRRRRRAAAGARGREPDDRDARAGARAGGMAGRSGRGLPRRQHHGRPRERRDRGTSFGQRARTGLARVEVSKVCRRPSPDVRIRPLGSEGPAHRVRDLPRVGGASHAGRARGSRSRRFRRPHG
jgi:hypothetical protein